MSQVVKTPSTADRALLKSFRAWAREDFAQVSDRFSPEWRATLREHWVTLPEVSTGNAWEELRREHGAAARPDPDRVHHSWFVRALRHESEAVIKAVTDNSPESLRWPLIRELGLNPNDIAPDFPADPEVVGWAKALFAERLVGALPEEDDPSVIVALTRLSSLDLGRLIKVCGLVKHAFAIETPRSTPADEAEARFTPIDRVRLGFFRRRIGQPDARLSPLARDDLRYFEGDRRRAHLRLGLVTFGRLLEFAGVERARWAIQHVPYPVAKLIRRKMALPIPRRSVFAWESWILETAWTRLLSESRMSGGRDWLPELEEGEDS